MPNEESPEQEIHDEAGSIPSTTSDFGDLFVKLLETEYADAVAKLPGENADREYLSAISRKQTGMQS